MNEQKKMVSWSARLTELYPVHSCIESRRQRNVSSGLVSFLDGPLKKYKTSLLTKEIENKVAT